MLQESNSFNLNRRISAVPFGLWPELAAKLTGDSTFPDLSKLLIAFLVS
jgi:hypothetical protein